jgi:hypothetical protein
MVFCFQCLAHNIKRWLKNCSSCVVYSQNWLNLPRDDLNFCYIFLRMITTLAANKNCWKKLDFSQASNGCCISGYLFIPAVYIFIYDLIMDTLAWLQWVLVILFYFCFGWVYEKDFLALFQEATLHDAVVPRFRVVIRFFIFSKFVM